jgi:hypothetical protein
LSLQTVFPGDKAVFIFDWALEDWGTTLTVTKEHQKNVKEYISRCPVEDCLGSSDDSFTAAANITWTVYDSGMRACVCDLW